MLHPGERTLNAQEEAIKQAAVADRLILTKTDLVDAQTVLALETRLRDLNPGAPIIRAHNGALSAVAILNAGFDNLASKSKDVQNWVNAEAYTDLSHHDGGGHHHHHHDHDDHDDYDHDGHEHHGHHHDPNRHDDRITAVSYTLDEPISAESFETWLETLVLSCGPDLLRLKAIIHVEGLPKPFVVHGVQHIFHPPVALMDWPSEDHQSRIVVIGRDISDAFLRKSFGVLGVLPAAVSSDDHGNHIGHTADASADDA